MRLVKLIAYSLLAYVLYELYLGMTEGAEVVSSGSTKPPARRPRREPGASTGGGGKTVPAQDSGGAQATRPVGRGVVR